MTLPILYKRSNSKQHINQWEIEIEGNKFRTITGFVGMKMFTGDWTECFAKNKGKKNCTTDESQAEAEAKALWQKRIDVGYWEDINNCDKKVFFAPMLAEDYKELKKEPTYPLIVQPKLDGMRSINKDDGMWSRKGKPVISAPHIDEALRPIFEKYPDMILDGELYTSRSDVDFNTIISCVRKTKPKPDDIKLSREYIEYFIYDIPNVDGNNRKTIDRVNSLINDNYGLSKIPFIKIVPYYIVNNETELKSKLAEFIEAGYEGLMVRTMDSFYENKRSKSLLKFKEFIDEEYTILGVKEGEGKLSNKIGALFFERNGKPFKSAVNGTHKYLEELFLQNDLIGKPATVRYFELTTDGVPRFPKVVEIRDYE